MSRASHKDSENVFHVSIFRRIHTFLSILDISSSACRYFLAVAKFLLLIFNEVHPGCCALGDKYGGAMAFSPRFYLSTSSYRSVKDTIFVQRL